MARITGAIRRFSGKVDRDMDGERAHTTRETSGDEWRHATRINERQIGVRHRAGERLSVAQVVAPTASRFHVWPNVADEPFPPTTATAGWWLIKF